MKEGVGTEAIEGEFDEPYIDVEEWRESPVRHRYFHGGFLNTETRFSIYFPRAELYKGRFFQHITPVPDSENLAQHMTGEQDKIGFSFASGGYFLETNGGGVTGRPGSLVDPTIAAYRANAASAQYSRGVAAQMYGEHRPFGYAFGGSGGGYRTIGGAENTTGIWDGVVPYVIGSPMAIPNMFTVRMHAQRVLRHKLNRIVDAFEPGGNGNVFEDLDEEERDALVEVTRMGFPLRSWFGHRTMGMHAFPVLYRGVVAVDPTYFEEFWTEPGYLGFEMPPSLQRDRVRRNYEIVATITEHEAGTLGISVGTRPGQPRGGVDTAWRGPGELSKVPVAVRLSSMLKDEVQGAELLVTSGAAEGARLLLLSVVGDVAVFGPGDTDALIALQPGDAVIVDNSGFLAAQTYHRHQVPDSSEFPVWDQFRNSDGSPIFPQRPTIIGPLFAAAAAGTVQTGQFAGKMIVVESMLDREAFPWQADWYRSRVHEHLGDSIDDHFRLWFTDNALHGDDEIQESPTHTVSYLGVLHQALRDLSQWVEEGIPPPPNTSYLIENGQVILPTDAWQRCGVQPVVALTVDNGDRASVATGDEVILRATARVPEDTGSIVSMEWDFEGTGQFSLIERIDIAEFVDVERRYSYLQDGTYFPTVRVVAHRDGDPSSPYARIQNLARVRVVVSRSK
jgi:hypothetical protein